MAKLKENDEVIVITGKHKGAKGKIKHINNKKNTVIVEGVNFLVKSVKPDPKNEQPGGLTKIEGPIAISNVMHFNPHTRKADKVGYKIHDDKKIRYYKSNGEHIDK